MPTYHAFFSYSHQADARLAPVLQRALERLGTPWWRRSPVRVFRDDSSLPASAALWSAIEQGLSESQYFVLLASPTSARSVWVDKEVRWWLAHRPHERLLIAITAGRVAYSLAARDFDWDHTDCLPPSLRGVFPAEPLWTDFRFATRPEHLSLRHSGFRSAALGLAAAIRQVAKDDLERLDIRQHRRAAVLAAAALASIAGLGLATALAYRSAREESSIAQGNLLQAESRRLAAEALDQLDGGKGLETATLKAVIAWRLSPTEDAVRALRRIEQAAPDVTRVLRQHTSAAMALAFSRDGQRLATAGSDGVVLQWSLADGQATGAPLVSERQQIEQLRFSRDGTHLLVAGTRADDRNVPTLAVFRVADGARLPTGEAWRQAFSGRPYPQGSSCMALSPAGTRAAVVRNDTLVAIDTGNGQRSTLWLPHQLQQIVALGFIDESHLHIVAGEHYGGADGGGLRAGLVVLSKGRISLGPVQKVWDFSSCDGFTSFSDDGLRVALHGTLKLGDEGWMLWRIDQGLALRAMPMPVPRPQMVERTGHHAPDLGVDGRRVAYGLSGTGRVWAPDLQRMVKTLPRINGAHGPPLALSPDGRLLAALDNGTPVIWSLDAELPQRRIEGSRCGNSAVDEACIQRLCERITAHLDEQQLLALVGQNRGGLVAALQGSACSADRPPGTAGRR